jgi:phosphoribosylformylglycinamidine cyclo-ligase
MPAAVRRKTKQPRAKAAYAAAGVDVELGNRLKGTIQDAVRATHGPNVLGRIGAFGGFFRAAFPGMRDPVLVSSIDGVGTKLKLAFALNSHESVARDLVNHCVNDIAVTGARPLFFLDYIGSEKLEPPVFKALLRGFSRACRESGCALIGGETAQLPDMYHSGEYDLAGCIVGVVDRAKIIDGSAIAPGDVIIGLESDGLHTNGYTLARKVLFGKLKLGYDERLPGTKLPLGRELLRVHRSYLAQIQGQPAGAIKGAAHITGGGLIDNLPRILPKDCDATIDCSSWKVPAIFDVIQAGGNVDADEMYRVFNMGIGMTLIVSKRRAIAIAKAVRGRIIGRVESGSGQVLLR